MKRVAIMQPYVFPYLGYFQLLQAVDTFVFYDDVNFIKGGWINRNRILINGSESLFTIPCRGASSNKKINEVEVDRNGKWKRKLIASIVQSYSRANFFSSVFPVLENVIQTDHDDISIFAQRSVEACVSYLGLTTALKVSSRHFPDTFGKDRADRLIAITKSLAASTYINPQGGRELYDKAYFAEHGIALQFLEAGLTPYPQQQTDAFIPGLSIIDLMMNISPEEIRDIHLTNYRLS